MPPKLKLDRAGMAAMLKSPPVAAEVKVLASEVAGRVSFTSHDGPVPVKTSSYTTDRAAASVTIEHASGMGAEAKYGTLSKAAASVGLQVRRKA